MNKFKKLTIIALVTILFVSSSLQVNAAQGRSEVDLQSLSSDVATIARYDSWAFYDKSAPELIELQMDANMVSFVGYCEENQVDNLVLYIRSTSGTFQETIPFDADGILSSCFYVFPKDEYKVWIMSTNPNIKKINVSVCFSVEKN